MKKAILVLSILFFASAFTCPVFAYDILDIMPMRIDSWPGQPTPPVNPSNPTPPTYPPANPGYPNYPGQPTPGYPGNGNYESAQQLLNSGHQYYNQGNYYSAIQSFRRLLDRYPYDYRAGEACFLTAESYLRIRDFSNAITFYRKVTSSYHQYYQVDRAAYYVGYCYVKLNNYYSAVRELRNFTIQYRNSPLVDDAYYVMGRTYENLNDRTNAISAYQTVVYNYPQSDFHAKARDRLAVLQNQGVPEQPPYYPPNPGYPVPPIYPGNPTTPSLSDQELYNRGHTELAKGNYTNAITYFEELRKLYPNSYYADDALLWMGKTRYEQKNYLESIRLFETFNRYYPNSELMYDAIFGLASSEFKLAKTNASNRRYFSQAARHFLLFQQQYPSHKWSAEALYMVGECYEALSDYSTAKYYYQQVVDYYANTPSAIKARQKLGQMIW